MTVTPLTSAEFAAKVNPSAATTQAAAFASGAAAWPRDAFVSAAAPSQFLTYEKSAPVSGQVPAPPYTSKIDYMSESEIWDEWARLEEEGRAMDYTGLSDVEIYQAIYDRYAEALGEAFINAPAYLCVTGGRGAAQSEFFRELYRQFGSVENMRLVNRERMGCSGMSYAEAERTVMQKYAGKELTMRDVSYMNMELMNMGYNNGSYTALNRSVMRLTDQGDMSKINLFFDSSFDMAGIKHSIDTFGIEDTAANRKSKASLYAFFASLIQYDIYHVDKGQQNALAEILALNTTTGEKV